MKIYIKPQTEIIIGAMYLMAGLSTNEGVGDGNEFAKETSFEAFEDSITNGSQNLWAE